MSVMPMRASRYVSYHGHAKSRVRRYATPHEVGPAAKCLGAHVLFVRHDKDPAARVQAGEHGPALQRLWVAGVSRRLRGRRRRDVAVFSVGIGVTAAPGNRSSAVETGAVPEETRDETLRPQEAIAQEEVEGQEPGRVADLLAHRAHEVRELPADEHVLYGGCLDQVFGSQPVTARVNEPGLPAERCREGPRELDVFAWQELRREGGRADFGKNPRGELVVGSARMR
ncbi:uncharacterized protein GLRG_11851 [Colletotrichum graminicola M1.001]|uniref:Uncharacterized protein n=1 Tax=Colletotrichum graminicola (strain M1.001 / M2 / FGSC 10212) TaxID=645133 RepID=E3R0R4_COLGM|nr:uncharacterized protein GLRG_11851 [Colletotrichum graminicola M1.001]EFQ36702.1 hypothetical protein GLRG_11851 [Colletotrichum graminicola M1.001]